MRYLVLVLVTLFLSGCKTAEDEIFVIPENFTGYVIVIFNQPNGEKPTYFENSRVYVIPPSGILKTRFEPNFGWSSPSQFYYREIDIENRIPYILRPDSIPSNSIVAHGQRYGGLCGYGVKGGYVDYTSFFVGNKDQIFLAYSKLEYFLMKNLSDSCEKKYADGKFP